MVSFDAITLFDASQRVFIVVNICFVMDSVRKLLGTLSYISNIMTFLVSLIYQGRVSFMAMNARGGDS
jgi:hypothetical protein